MTQFLAASSCAVVLSTAAHSGLLSRGAGNSSQQCKFTALWWERGCVSAEDTKVLKGCLEVREI